MITARMAQEALGLLGAILMAVPSFQRYRLQAKRDWLGRLPVGGALADAREHFADLYDARIERARRIEALAMAVGFTLLSTSFLFGLVHELCAVAR